MDHRIIEAIQKERDKQMRMWHYHDRVHTSKEWRFSLMAETGKVSDEIKDNDVDAALVKVAAVAIAALEARGKARILRSPE